MSADASFLNFFLDEATDILTEWEKACLEIEKDASTEANESLYRCAHNLKSGSAAVGLSEFSAFVHRIEDLISRYLAGKLPRSPDLVRLFLDVQTILSTWAKDLRADPQHVPQAPRLKAEADAAKLLNPAAVPPLSAETSAPSVPSAPSPALEAPHKQEKPASPNEPKVSSLPSRPHDNVRVAAGKLDMLIQLVGELTTQQAIVWHARQNSSLESKLCDHAIQLIQKNSKDLQNLALSLRMQPLDGLFQRLQRAATDLARTQEKKLKVVTEGEFVELDRAVIERIGEALMHVIRNAVDHGVEPPASRMEQQKPESATLRLEGSQEPGGILIKICDDGRGLHLEKILKKAIEKGIARPDQKYSQTEIQNFIFAHGFSTAEAVTDVSGRGVGMDVVKTAVQSIGGTISIDSESGKGTNFSINLPTTLSIVDALIVEVDGNRYAVPVQDVSEVVDLSELYIESVAGHGRLLALRQEVMPVEKLRDHIPRVAAHAAEPSHEPPASGTQQTSAIQPALLIRSQSEALAFQVDRILGQQPVSVRQLPGGLDTTPGYNGASILGDGDPCVIVNLPELVRHHVDRQSSDSQITAAASETLLRKAGHKLAADEKKVEPYLLIRLQQHLLATPLLSVREIVANVAISPALAAGDMTLGCIDIRGTVVPVINLSALLGLSHVRNQAAANTIIITESDNGTHALVVDKVESVVELAEVSATDAVQQPLAHLLSVESSAIKHGDLILTKIDLRKLLATTAPLANHIHLSNLEKAFAPSAAAEAQWAPSEAS